MFDIAHFLESVAENGFTRTCDEFKINRARLRLMCEFIEDNSEYRITPFTTKQQIVYYYCAAKLKT